MSTGFSFSSNILKMTWTSFCWSVRIQIHGLSGYLLLQFWSYSFNILYDVYTHVHVHRIFIFIKYLIMTGSCLDLVIFLCPCNEKWGFLSNIYKMTGSWTSFPSYYKKCSYIMETWFVWGIIPISPQVIPLYLHIRNEKLKVLSVYKLSMIEYRAQC